MSKNTRLRRLAAAAVTGPVLLWGAAATTSGAAALAAPAPPSNDTVLATLNWQGKNANSDAFESAITRDAHFAVFGTYSTNMVDTDGDGVPDDDNDTSDATHQDVYVRDLIEDETVRVNQNSSGEQSDRWATAPAITMAPDGSKVFVAFASMSSNLADDNLDGQYDDDLPPANSTRDWDVFVRELPIVDGHLVTSGPTVRVSVAQDGSESNDPDAYAGTPQYTSICTTGTDVYVAFTSEATNLTPSAAVGAGARQVFFRRLPTDDITDESRATTGHVSVDMSKSSADADSIDVELGCDTSTGTVTAVWQSAATDLVIYDGLGDTDVFRRRITDSTPYTGMLNTSETASAPTVSADGRSYAYVAGSNVTHVDASGTARTVPTSFTNLLDTDVSSDGRAVVFSGFDPAFGFQNVYLWVPADGNTLETVAVSLAGGTLCCGTYGATSPTVSDFGGDGSVRVAFESKASNIVRGDIERTSTGIPLTDVFVRVMPPR